MKRVLIFLLISLPLLTFAQSNFVPGYIITSSKDSLNGYINYKEFNLNPSSIDFKSTLGSSSKAYTADDCNGFGIIGEEAYQSFPVNISQSTEDIYNLSIGPDTSFKTEKVFLYVMQTGKNVTLYAYADKIKLRFYVREANAPVPVELKQLQYFNNSISRNIAYDNIYISQLLELAKKHNTVSPAVEKKIRQARYAKSDIVKVVGLINGQQVSAQSKGSMRLFAGAGLNVKKADYANALKKIRTDGKSFEQTYAPLFAVGLDWLTNKAVGRNFIRLELSYSTSKGGFSNALETHSYNEGIIDFSPQYIHNFYNADKFKVYAGAGLDLSLSRFDKTSNKPNSGGTDPILKSKETRTLAAFSGKAGFILNKKIECSLSYTLPYYTYLSARSKFNPYVVRMQTFSIGINYLFGMK